MERTLARRRQHMAANCFGKHCSAVDIPCCQIFRVHISVNAAPTGPEGAPSATAWPDQLNTRWQVTMVRMIRGIRRAATLLLLACATLVVEVRTLTILHVNDLHAHISPE